MPHTSMMLASQRVTPTRIHTRFDGSCGVVHTTEQQGRLSTQCDGGQAYAVVASAHLHEAVTDKEKATTEPKNLWTELQLLRHLYRGKCQAGPVQVV